MTFFSRTIVRACRVLLAIMAMTSLYACESKQDEGYSPNGDEPSLREKYNGFPALPAVRDVFDAAVTGAGLRAEKRVKRYTDGGPLTCPAPLRAPEDIWRRTESCLLIYGESSPAYSEQYVAFVDAKGSVIYVENRYGYPSL